MKSIASLQAHLDLSQGLEPMIIVEVQWGGSTGTKLYAKKNLTGYDINPILKDFSAISSKISFLSFTQVQTISITLEDIDQSLRIAFEAETLEGKTVRVLQAYEGIDYGDEIVLLKGRILGPVKWEEGSRRINFQVVDIPEEIDLGTVLYKDVLDNPPFSGLKNRDHTLEDQMIPYGLGVVVKAPALRLTRELSAVLVNKLTFYDPSEEGTNSTYIDLLPANSDEIVFQGIDLDTVEYLEYQNNIIYVDFQYMVDELGVEDENGRIARFTITNFNPEKYEFRTLTIAERIESDPDYDNPKVIWFEQGDILVQGCMVALGSNPINSTRIDAYNRCERQVGRKCWFEEPWTERYSYADGYGTYNARRTILLNDEHDVDVEAIYAFKPEDSTYPNIRREMILQVQPGEIFRIWNPNYNTGYEKEIYIVNEIPSTILSVQARLQNNQLLQEVPYELNNNKSYYRIINNWANTGRLAIEMDFPLTYRNEGWGDEIYVTFHSDTEDDTIDGNVENPGDAWGNGSSMIRYIIENADTDITIDDTTFNAIKSKVANIPISFYITNVTKLFNFVGLIANSIRCGLVLNGETLKIVYLGEEPTEVMTITDDYVLQQSILMEAPNHYDLSSKIRTFYTPNFSLQPRTKTVTENLAILGHRTANLDSLHVNAECVTLFANFWLHRQAQQWRQLTITMSLDALKLEVFDPVLIDLSGVIGDYTSITESSILGEVKSIDYDIENSLVVTVIEIASYIGLATYDETYWGSGSLTRPGNPFVNDLKKLYIPNVTDEVPPHKLEQHTNVTKMKRRSSHGNWIEGNTDFQDGDILRYDSESGGFTPQSFPDALSEAGVNDDIPETGTGILLKHSHQGPNDGGWAGFLSGSK